MAFCSNCGAQVADGSAFCPNCGTPQGAQAPPPNAGQQQYQQTPPPQGGQYQQYQQAPPPGYVPPSQPVNYADPVQDWQANKLFGILAYLGPLVFVTILAAPKESRYSRFHANQGLVLFIAEIAVWVILGIVSAVVGVTAVTSLGYFLGGGWVAVLIIRWVLNIAILILAILGIVNAYGGKQQPLPVIGKFEVLKPR